MQSELQQVIDRIVRMGWLLPDSPVAGALFADLVRQARDEGWTPDQFREQALRQLRKWVSRKLHLAESVLLDDTTQNFILRMMEQRPDLFYVPRRGTRESQLVGVLWFVYLETCRQHKRRPHEGWSGERVDGRGESPDVIAERADLLSLAKQWLDECSPRQRAALRAKFTANDPMEGDTPENRRKADMLRCHALRALRRRAESLGLRSPHREGGRIYSGHARRRRVCILGDSHRCTRTLRSASSHAMIHDPITALDPKMAAKQQAINEKNARALEALFDSLPVSLKDRVDVLTAVRETFEREFARHIRGARRGHAADDGPHD